MKRLALALLVALLPCCRPAVHELATEVPTTAAVALTDEQMRRRYADVLTSPEIEQATEELSGVAARGIALGLSDTELAARLRPAIVELTHAIAAALAESTRELERPATQLAASMTSAILERAREDLPRTLAPAIAETLRTPEVKAAIGGTTQQAATAAVHGTERAAERIVPDWFWVALVAGGFLLLAVPLAWLIRIERRLRALTA